MKKVNHILEKGVYYFSWYKWLCLGLFVLLLLCLSLKCCTNKRQVPNQSVRLRSIDTMKIKQIKNDPLGRYAVNDLINIYLKENTKIHEFVTEFQKRLPNDTIILNYYAEAYKRVQFSVNEKRKEFIKALARADTAHVKFITNEWVFKNQQNTNDPDFNTVENTWFYKQIGVFDAWQTTKGNPNIKIAVLDDGFDLEHIELRNSYVSPWNVFDYSKNVYANSKTEYHGTHVAGSIVAEANNNFGIAGVAPNCKLIPIQISDESGIITTSSLLDGIFYALKNDAKVINISIAMSIGPQAKNLSLHDQKLIENFSFLEEEELWDEVFEIARKENVVIVQAAGNDGVIASMDPMKRSKNTIIVGAINESGERAYFSDKGVAINVYAPGTQIYSTLPNNQMGYLDGTSMASPIVAGCVGLVLSVQPDLSTKEVIALFSEQNNLNIPFNINDLISKSL